MRYFIAIICLFLFSHRAFAENAKHLSAKVWAEVDKAYQADGQTPFTSTEAIQKIQDLKASQDAADLALAAIMERAKADSRFAAKIQEVIHAVRSKYPKLSKVKFYVDGEFAHRSIYEMMRLYQDSESRQELIKALQDAKLPLTEATTKQLNNELLSGRTLIDGLNLVNGQNGTHVCDQPGDYSNPLDRREGGDPNQQTVPLYTPQQAVTDALSQSLKFVGIGVVPNSGYTLPSCVFQNDKVLVVYDLCTKSEQSATSVSIYSVGGGSVHFGAQNSSGTGNLSALSRAQYDAVWLMKFMPSAPVPSNITQEASNSFLSTENTDSKEAINCSVGGSLKLSGVDLHPKCVVSLGVIATRWAKDAQDFWQTPPGNWYTFLKQMRAKVSEIP